ncbi:MAG TPA: ATP-binding protein [Bryobacteraceae bacterium]|nr:ATP-binding protein [Bryobacteraceae bacterium]HPU72732.1 ATP-binding protein [Bryobacteraceae bacterium]
MRGLKLQFTNALLMVLTVAAVISAAINFQQQKKFRLPDDGVTWTERDAGVEALHVAPGSPAANAGIRTGDTLLKIAGTPIQKATDVSRALVRLGSWNKAAYRLRRNGVEFETTLVVGQSHRDYPALYYQYIVGLAYLGIGLFVFFRRGSAPKAVHFYVLCLASFVLTTFHYTGKLNNFDKVMYFGNVAAGLFAPTIFVHFCLAFPERRGWWRRRLAVALLYLPASLLLLVNLGISSGRLLVGIPGVELRWLLDRVWIAFLTGMYLLGAVVLTRAYRKAEDAIVRKQITWLRNGAIAGVAPFAIFYSVPYLLGVAPTVWMNLAVFSLLLVPLTWAYAIVRYRLMDVDIIFQQGYVYTLATICVLGVFYGLIFWLGDFEGLGPTSTGILILFAAFIFQPIRDWIREQLDRYVFYKDRYDYRVTLVEFARELSSETDLDAMLQAVSDRLIRTLSIQRLAFFLSDESETRFELKRAFGSDLKPAHLGEVPLDLSFLTSDGSKQYFFFERTRHLLDVVTENWPPSVRQTIAELDFTYYMPCTVRGRTIAWIGVSRNDKGDFLTSDDIELLITVCGYIGIAVENARLYSSLERRMEAYERLKEYSENIVESINVGILTVDLDDRVESWNAQLEQLTGIERTDAIGRRLEELFPAELVEQFSATRGESGIHHIYRFELHSRQAPKVIPMPAGNGANGGGRREQEEAARETVVNIAVAPLVSRDLQQIGRLIIFDDITERDQLERKLVQADKLSSIGLLAAGVAHEVNTPLAVISTYAQMLAKQVSGDEQKSRLLDKIAKQTFRASEIVNSLLNFSRTSPTTFDELDLNRVIQESLVLIQHQLEKAGIKVQLELDPRLPSIKGNFGKLQQVFLNLFLNARDAMGAGGTLTVRTRLSEETADIEVIDTGHGIQPENLSRIFDPFFTTKAVRKGTGLGLSVTYGIVREHNGVIEVDSQPGEGTRFRLEFPLARKAVHA